MPKLGLSGSGRGRPAMGVPTAIPLMTCRNVLIDVETGTRTSVPRIKVEGRLFTARPASGMKAA